MRYKYILQNIAIAILVVDIILAFPSVIALIWGESWFWAKVLATQVTIFGLCLIVIGALENED